MKHEPTHWDTLVRWLIGLEHVSLGRLILGTACAWVLTLALPIWLVVTPSFDDEQRLTIEDEILDVKILRSRNDAVLDFALRNQPVRFRVQSGIFTAGFNGQVPGAFRPGTMVRVQVSDSDYREPLSPVTNRIPTVSVNSIQVGNTKILPLEVARRWHEENRGWGYYLLFTFVIPSTILLSWATRIKLRSAPAD